VTVAAFFFKIIPQYVVPGILQKMREAAQKPPEPILVRVDPATRRAEYNVSCLLARFLRFAINLPRRASGL